jgi:hypothetical protein
VADQDAGQHLHVRRDRWRLSVHLTPKRGDFFSRFQKFGSFASPRSPKIQGADSGERFLVTASLRMIFAAKLDCKQTSVERAKICNQISG